MNTIIKFTKRNINLYLRNKSTVFFSLLSTFIIIGLYALFLGDVQVTQFSDLNVNIKDIEWLVNSWIMGGIIAINAVNVTIAALAVMVEDKEKNQIKDFIVAPIKRSQIVLGYIFSSIIIGFMMSVITFIVAELYIISQGGKLLSLILILKLLLGILATSIMVSSIAFYGFSFVKNEKTVSTISTIIGTLIGFLTGVYVPIGIMPDIIQKMIKIFPITYSATMFKEIFVAAPTSVVFKNAPVNVLNDYNLFNSNVIYIYGQKITYPMMLLIILTTALIFFIFSVIRIRRQKQY